MADHRKFFLKEGHARCYVCKTSKPLRFFTPGSLRKRRQTVSTICQKCSKRSNKFYYKKNREYRCEYMNKLRNTNPIFTKYQQIKFRSIKKGWPFLITKDEFEHWFKATPEKCFYCDVVDLTLCDKVWKRRLLTFSIDRKNNNFPYTIENICFACDVCNTIKRDIFSEVEFRELAQKYIKPKWLQKLESVLEVQADGRV